MKLMMTKIPDEPRYNLKKWIGVCEIILAENGSADASHDISHCRRVWRLCQTIADRDNLDADRLALLTAAYLHDIRNYPKNSALRRSASVQSADEAVNLLTTRGFPISKLPVVHHAISAHSFSAQITATSAEARILQDADRIEALGAIGLARVFSVGSSFGAALFDPEDPLARNRALDDKKFSLDHFQTKLFQLPSKMNTEAGKEIAERRVLILKSYVASLMAELNLTDEPAVDFVDPELLH